MQRCIESEVDWTLLTADRYGKRPTKLSRIKLHSGLDFTHNRNGLFSREST